jgi:hypothetical protein
MKFKKKKGYKNILGFHRWREYIRVEGGLGIKITFQGRGGSVKPVQIRSSSSTGSKTELRDSTEII